MRGDLSRTKDRQMAGATMVEFALMASLFLIAILGLFEVSRVMAIRAALMKGAQDGATLAAQLPEMFIDPARMATNCNERRAFLLGRRKVINEALAFPSALFIGASNSTNSMQRLADYNYSDVGMIAVNCPAIPVGTALGQWQSINSAAVIRPPRSDNLTISPRERIVNLFPSMGSPTILYPGTLTAGAFGIPAGTPSYTSVLASLPICVELQAEVDLLFGILGSVMRLEGHACSYQEGAGQAGGSLATVTTSTTSTTTSSTTTTTPTLPTTTTTGTPTTTSTSTTLGGPPTTSTSTSTTTTATGGTGGTTTTTVRTTTTTSTTTTTTTTLCQPPNPGSPSTNFGCDPDFWFPHPICRCDPPPP